MSTDDHSNERVRRPAWLNEDWLAVFAGLGMIALVLVGIIPTGLIP